MTPSLRRVPSVRFPALNSTMSHYDFSPFVFPHFLLLLGNTDSVRARFVSPFGFPDTATVAIRAGPICYPPIPKAVM